MIFSILTLSIAIILFCILVLKLNPAISLILGAIFIGLTSNIGAVTTVNKIASGFGNLMGGIGLSVGFGVILGQLMSDSGAAKVIAQTLIKTSSKKFALYALGLTGFILSIPVFYDVTFVILAPLMGALGLDTPVLASLTVMAIGAGAMTVSHANDSYYWVVTNFSDIKAQDGYKTQTLMTLVIGIFGMINVFLLSLFF